jgi:diguanylate cyclase (GGDEF)-like protein
MQDSFQNPENSQESPVFSGQEGEGTLLYLPEGIPEIPRITMDQGMVLLVDDDPFQRRFYQEILGRNHLFTQFLEADNGIKGFKLLNEHEQDLDLVLCDVEMPEFDGFKFLQMRGARRELMQIPVIIITGRESQESRNRGLLLGASDYLQKPVDPEELYLRAQKELKLRRAYQGLNRALEELRKLSITDPLTGLKNRRHFMDFLTREFHRAIRYGHPLGLIVADLDHFKKVNDRYGHQAGDYVLKHFAEILQYNQRTSDLCARYGGEEFAVVLPETDLKGATLVAQRLCHEVEASVFTYRNEKIAITASFGVSAHPDSGAKSVGDLIRLADQALYRAKEKGRNRVEVATLPS